MHTRKFVVSFCGRRSGSLGSVNSKHVDTVIAFDNQSAWDALYEAGWEHISKFRVHGRFPHYRQFGGFQTLVWVESASGRWVSAGGIMPQVDDSRQQPKSLAEKMLKRRSDAAKYCCSRVPVERTSSLKFTRFGRDGALVSLADGRCIGVIKQTPSDAVLAASPGIQSWSCHGAENAPTDGHFERR